MLCRRACFPLSVAAKENVGRRRPWVMPALLLLATLSAGAQQPTALAGLYAYTPQGPARVALRGISSSGEASWAFAAQADPLVVSFSQASASSPEHVGAHLPQLSVLGGLVAEGLFVEVALAAAVGTATPGVDYSPDFAEPLVVAIPAGDYSSAQLIAIPRLAILADQLVEANETINLILVNPAAGVAIGMQGSASYTIVNDNNLVVAFNQATGRGWEYLGGNLPQLIVSGAISTTAYRAQILLASPAGSATPGVDYSPAFRVPIEVAAPAGNYTLPQAIPIPGLAIIDDETPEGEEDIMFTLASVEMSVGAQSTSSYTILDDEPLAAATLTVSAHQVYEDGGPVFITVSISSPSANAVQITLGLAGEADPKRYSISSSTLVIPPGSSSATATLTPMGNESYGGDKAIVVSIARLVNAKQDTPQRETLVIVDDEPMPTVALSIDQLSISENNGKAVVTATLSGVSEEDVILGLLLSGSAQEGEDYYLAPQPIVIRAGSLSAHAELLAIPDRIYEVEELAVIQVNTVVHAMIDPARSGVQARIFNYGEKPTLSLFSSLSKIDEHDGVAILTIELSQASDQPITVELVTSGSASAADFVLSQAQVIFAAGVQRVEVSLAALENSTVEEKTVIVQLAQAASAHIDGRQYRVKIVITDNDGLTPDGGFSPNGDGVNDTWTIANIEKYPENHIRIYNRWGNVVYEMKGYNNVNKAFDGRGNTGGWTLGDAVLPDGIYFYQIAPGNGSPDVSGFIAMFR